MRIIRVNRIVFVHWCFIALMYYCVGVVFRSKLKATIYICMPVFV